MPRERPDRVKIGVLTHLRSPLLVPEGLACEHFLEVPAVDGRLPVDEQELHPGGVLVRLLVRGRRDFAATRAVRRDRVFPFQATDNQPDPLVSRKELIDTLSRVMDTVEEIAVDFERDEQEAITRVLRAKMRQAAGLGDEAEHIRHCEAAAFKASRKAVAIRALIAQPKTTLQIEHFWTDISRPDDPLLPHVVGV